MSHRILIAGTKIYFGASSRPMSKMREEAILLAITQVPGITEAYLPQCYIEGDREAHQVLVIVVQYDCNVSLITEALMKKILLSIPTGQFIEILPFSSGTIPNEVRESGCKIFPKRGILGTMPGKR